jgi:hypothetical protein
MKIIQVCARCFHSCVGDMVMVEMHKEGSDEPDMLCAPCVAAWFEYTGQLDDDVQVVMD